MSSPWFYPLADQLTDSIATLVSAGTVEWKHLSEIIDYWKTSYGEVPFSSDCDFNVLIENTSTTFNLKIKPQENMFQLFPNYGNGMIHFENAMNKTISIYNQLGKLICSIKITSNSNDIDCAFLSSGIYYIRSKNQEEKYFKN